MATLQKCSVCGEDKPLNEFYPRKRGGHNRQCKPCMLSRRAPADKEAKRRAAHKYRIASYGITVAEFEALVKAQHGRCAICGANEGSKGKRLFIDHDHVTGRVRGLLCHNCNAGLGHFKDDRTLMENAIDYLGGWTT